MLLRQLEEEALLSNASLFERLREDYWVPIEEVSSSEPFEEETPFSDFFAGTEALENADSEQLTLADKDLIQQNLNNTDFLLKQTLSDLSDISFYHDSIYKNYQSLQEDLAKEFWREGSLLNRVIDLNQERQALFAEKQQVHSDLETAAYSLEQLKASYETLGENIAQKEAVIKSLELKLLDRVYAQEKGEALQQQLVSVENEKEVLLEEKKSLLAHLETIKNQQKDVVAQMVLANYQSREWQMKKAKHETLIEEYILWIWGEASDVSLENVDVEILAKKLALEQGFNAQTLQFKEEYAQQVNILNQAFERNSAQIIEQSDQMLLELASFVTEHHLGLRNNLTEEELVVYEGEQKRILAELRAQKNWRL